MTALEYFHPEDFAGHVGLLDLGPENLDPWHRPEENPALSAIFPTEPMIFKNGSDPFQSAGRKDRTAFREKRKPLRRKETRRSLKASMRVIGDLRVSLINYHDQSGLETFTNFFLCGGTSHPLDLGTSCTRDLQVRRCRGLQDQWGGRSRRTRKVVRGFEGPDDHDSIKETRKSPISPSRLSVSPASLPPKGFRFSKSRFRSFLPADWNGSWSRF